ncbi:polysaccharide pyruvyl transferase family protein [Rhodococcus sp. CSLK01-03]|uniref:Polysaccharide pyruvyl transferase family protein n=1 Tax=Rhodococcus indonesiensis TaxID=3055869 RepID=A0ABT7RS98_9NOCA|nr:polysaccharide pyruvyl transferase family protein [Rhodococcus indonesiensis]MDM7490519.1 polysaccharide pyruvyl transferase family protein [Rhodococcus indonesiensis]
MAMKTILISGAEVRDARRGNRGAEHLLRESASKLRSLGYVPAVTLGQVDPGLRGDLALKQYVGNPRIRVLDRVVPGVDLGGLVTLNRLDGVLDASGYALGDPWGMHTAKWIARKYSQWNARGVRIVALPQSYGPFVTPGLGETVRSALSHCDLVIARDEQSYQNLMSIGVDPSICMVSPDITIAAGVGGPGKSRERRLVIVPNYNIVERNPRVEYIDCLRATCEWGASRGYKVVGLLHEGVRDLRILQEVADQAPLEVLDDLRGWAVKEYIANSSLVVAGRYHAVVAALSTETPVVTHSWSHKYRELLRDFGVEEWMCSPVSASETISLVERISAVPQVEHLRINRRRIVVEIEEMWNRVQEVLRARDSRTAGR